MGTHPIFESDFDCLTAMDNLIREFLDCLNKNRQEKMKRYESMLSSMKHGLKCNKSNCPEPHCESMKKLYEHTKNCNEIRKPSCSYCKAHMRLCLYHAKTCSEKRCQFPYCSKIKKN